LGEKGEGRRKEQKEKGGPRAPAKGPPHQSKRTIKNSARVLTFSMLTGDGDNRVGPSGCKQMQLNSTNGFGVAS
jgi:hypothetical protein